MQWMTLFQKELQENLHNKRWIWVPLVMILLAIMDPLSYYYLPQIIDKVGGVPDGTVFDIPDIIPTEAIMMSIGQLKMFGVLIIILISMGTISGEKSRGITEIILVKPVGYHHYITAKWAHYVLLITLSLFISLLTSWYYINLLFGELAFMTFIKVALFYGLWFIFVLTLTFFYNTLFNSPGLVAGVSLITIIIMSIINMIFNHTLTWFPNNLETHISEMLVTGKISTSLIASSIILIILISLFLLSAIFIFKKREKAV